MENTIYSAVTCPGIRHSRLVFSTQFDNLVVGDASEYLVNGKNTSLAATIAILFYRKLFGNRELMTIDYKLSTERNYSLEVTDYTSEASERITEVLRNLKVNFLTLGTAIVVPSIDSQTALVVSSVLRANLATVTLKD